MAAVLEPYFLYFWLRLACKVEYIVSTEERFLSLEIACGFNQLAESSYSLQPQTKYPVTYTAWKQLLVVLALPAKYLKSNDYTIHQNNIKAFY